MKYCIWGRKSENGPLQRLSGPWPSAKIAKRKKFAAQIGGCLDVVVRSVASKPLRGGGIRGGRRT